MRNYLKQYVCDIDKIIKKDNIENIDDVISNHLIKISFFQHERLIHLLVTFSYAFFLISFIFLTKLYPLLSIVVIILTIFLVFYVRHYFFLENNVQYLYKQYDILLIKKGNIFKK